MSSQKKKRIGSRRRAVNQDKPTEDDGSHVTEASAAQLCILGETTEVIDVLNNQDSSTAESPNPPSPEFTGSKRKLGSRRRNKGLHVKDFATQLDHKEDVEEKTEGSEIIRSTQMSLETHTEKPEEGSQESVPETFARRDSYLDAPTVLGSFEAQDSSSEKCPGTDIESLQPKSDNLIPDQEKTYSVQSEETVIGNPDRSDLSQGEKLKENTEASGISEVMSASVPSCPTVDPQLTHKSNDTGMSEELLVVFSETESEGRNIDSELLGHNEHFHDNYYQSEPLIHDESCTPQNTDLKYSADPKISLTPNEGSLKDEEQNEHLSSGQHAVSNEEHEITHSFDSGIRDVRGNSNTLSESVTEEAKITDTFRSELSTLESRDLSADKQEDLSLVDDQAIHPKQENFEALDYEKDEDSSADSPENLQVSGAEKVDILPGEVNVTQSQEGDTEPSAEEQGHSEMEQSNSSPKVNQNVQLSVAEYDHSFTEEALANSSDNELIIAATLSSETETEADRDLQDDSMEAALSDGEPTLTENISGEGRESTRGDSLEDTLEHFSLDFSLDGMQIGQSTFAEMLDEFSNVYSVTEKDGNKDTDIHEHSASESPLKSVNIPVTSEISAEEDSPRDSTDTECGIEKTVALPPNVGNLSTEDEENKEVGSSQGNEGQQEVQESYHDDEKSAWTNKENILSEKLMEQPEITGMCQSELGIVKSADGSPRKQEDMKSDDKQDEHVTEEKDSEALHQTEEEYSVDDTKDLQAGGLERAEAETGHVFKTEVQVEDEAKMESMFSSQTLHSEIPANLDLPPTELQQNDSVFNPIRSRRKLGSSRKTKLRQHAQDTDLSHQPKEEATGNSSDNDTTLPLTSEPTHVKEVLLAGDPSVQQSESSFQRSAVIKENVTDSMLGEEVVFSETPVTNTEIKESSNRDDGDERKNPIKEAESLSYLTGYESLRTDSEQPAEADSHPSGDRSLGENITRNQAYDLKDFVEEVGKPVDIQASGQDESVENSEDPTEETQAVTIMPDIEVNAAGASLNQQVHLDSGDSLQEQTKQKKRKMGSTRRTRTRRHNETDESQNVEEVRGPLVSVTTEVSQSESSEAAAKPPEWHESNKNSNVPDESAQSSMLEINVLAAVVKEDVHSVDTEKSEGNAAAIVEKSKPDDVTGAEVPSALNIGDVINADGSLDSLSEATQGAQNNEDRLESIALTQDQALKSAAEVLAAENIEKVKSELRGENPNSVTEEVPDKNVEMRTASLKSENRRRKMGSTRKNLGSQRKEEDLHRKQGEDGEATEAATNVACTNTENLKAKDDGSIQPKDIVLETVEHSYTEESYSRPKVTFEEHQPSPSVAPEAASTSPKPDVMSDTAPGGRRRKLGSHRKSQGYQRNRNQAAGGEEVADAQNGGSESTFIGQSVIKTTEEESPGLDKISEDEVETKPPPKTSTEKAAEQPKLLSEKSSAQGTQHPSTKISSGPESQKTLSLAVHSSGEAQTSQSYNVILIGDSCVGKTSYMKRVQTGKFSLDHPASVGTDSCMSTVAVDGKRVALQLWDTAGQERFHSITRQVFHKAQAFLLMYDITSSHSFSAVSYWANCIQESASDNVTILLLGNKSDSSKRQVKSQDGEILAKEYNFKFMECSAATGENVTQSLETVARILSEKCDTREEPMLLQKEPQKKKSSGCC